MFKKCDSKYEQIRPHPGRKGMAHSNRVTEENLEWGYSHIVGKIMDTNKMTSSRAAKCGEPGSKAEAWKKGSVGGWHSRDSGSGWRNRQDTQTRN